MKWKGYSPKHNTWELVTNIPDDILTKFDQERHIPASTHVPARAGLIDRHSMKAKCHQNFILND